MFLRKKQTEYRFVLDIDAVKGYFEENIFIGRSYKGKSSGNDRIEKEIQRYLEHMEWIKGYESGNAQYVVYHGKSAHWTGYLFTKYRELAQSAAAGKGSYGKANKDIENYVIRDGENATFYMLRVGCDLVKACVPKEQEAQMKNVFASLNNFVYKQAV